VGWGGGGWGGGGVGGGGGGGGGQRVQDHQVQSVNMGRKITTGGKKNSKKLRKRLTMFSIPNLGLFPGGKKGGGGFGTRRGLALYGNEVGELAIQETTVFHRARLGIIEGIL